MVFSAINAQYEEQRLYPRLRLDAPAVILCANQQLMEADVFDISPDGLQIRCSRDAVQSINPTGKSINPQDNVLVYVLFSLPANDGNVQIKVVCKAYYFMLTQDSDKNDVALGLKFKKFEGTCGRYVEQFIQRAMEPTIT